MNKETKKNTEKKNRQRLTVRHIVPVRGEKLIFSSFDELKQLGLVAVRAAKGREATEEDVGDYPYCPHVHLQTVSCTTHQATGQHNLDTFLCQHVSFINMQNEAPRHKKQDTFTHKMKPASFINMPSSARAKPYSSKQGLIHATA